MITNNRWRKALTDDSTTIANQYECFKAPDDLSLDSVIGGEQGGSRTSEPTKSAEQIAAEAAAEKLKAEEKAKGDTAAKELEEANKVVAAKFGAVTLDAEGNAVDATGKVIKTKAEIETAIANEPPEAVELDGVTYKLDKDGNALAADGKVFKTKEELDAIGQEDIPIPLELIQKIGIHPVDESGKPKVYEDSVEGLMQLVNDVADVKRIANEKKLFEAYPDVEKYLKHKAAGGTNEQFFNVVKNDYSKVVLDEKNIEQHKTIYRNLLLEKGFAAEKANKLVEQAVATNEILAEGKDALKELQDIQTTKETELEATNKARIEKEIKETKEHWDGIKTLVNTGKLDNIVIPEVDRVPFFEYIAQAIDEEGNSKASIARNNEKIETRLLFDYYRFKGYNFDKLIQNAANTKVVSNLRQRFSKKPNTTSHATSVTAQGSGDDVNIDNIK